MSREINLKFVEAYLAWLHDEDPAPETGVYHYEYDVAEDGSETMCEAAELEDGRLYLRFVRVAP